MNPRRRMLGIATRGAAAVALARHAVPTFAQHDASRDVTMHRKPIPSSGEPLPVIGCGTWQGFDVAPTGAEYERLRQVLLALFDAGGSVVDSSPMYGRAEDVAGRLLEQTRTRDRAFVATKVWTSGREAGLRQMEESLLLLRAKTIDLMQVHNLVDWRTHLPVLRKWKENGRIRYVGVTHYTSSAYPQLEQVLRSEPLDFVQLNYSIDERTADERILPLAAERGVAVLVNRPFGGGGLLRSLRDRPLPSWASEIGCDSWAQLLLKFVVSHPAVTCAIPGTGNPDHMRANAQAGMGVMPDEAMRRRMIAEARF
ncbi:MAG: aldo/keto reductase [Burkholderiaceae bacterium]|nr:aldo/keto reductase [Burkholderiaceae bacterium]